MHVVFNFYSLQYDITCSLTQFSFCGSRLEFLHILKQTENRDVTLREAHRPILN